MFSGTTRADTNRPYHGFFIFPLYAIELMTLDIHGIRKDTTVVPPVYSLPPPSSTAAAAAAQHRCFVNDFSQNTPPKAGSNYNLREVMRWMDGHGVPYWRGEPGDAEELG